MTFISLGGNCNNKIFLNNSQYIRTVFDLIHPKNGLYNTVFLIMNSSSLDLGKLRNVTFENGRKQYNLDNFFLWDTLNNQVEQEINNLREDTIHLLNKLSTDNDIRFIYNLCKEDINSDGTPSENFIRGTNLLSRKGILEKTIFIGGRDIENKKDLYFKTNVNLKQWNYIYCDYYISNPEKTSSIFSNKLDYFLNGAKFSIVVPTFNRKLELSYCIDNLLNLNYPKNRYEILLCDDCSDEETVSYIKLKCSENINVRYIPNKTKCCGPSLGRNNGVERSFYEYILMIDSDDGLIEDTLSTLSKYIIAYDFPIYKFNTKNGFTSSDISIAKNTRFTKQPRLTDYQELWFVWDKCFKKSYLKDNNLVHLTYKDNSLNCHFVNEDGMFNMMAYLKNNKYFYIPELFTIQELYKASKIHLALGMSDKSKYAKPYLESTKIYIEHLKEFGYNLKEAFELIQKSYDYKNFKPFLPQLESLWTQAIEG